MCRLVLKVQEMCRIVQIAEEMCRKASAGRRASRMWKWRGHGAKASRHPNTMSSVQYFNSVAWHCHFCRVYPFFSSPTCSAGATGWFTNVRKRCRHRSSGVGTWAPLFCTALHLRCTALHRGSIALHCTTLHQSWKRSI